MKIIKHGLVVRYECDACGCVFLAARAEIEEKKNTNVVDADVFLAECPDCGKILEREVGR